ncbi:cell division protein ZapA [Nitrosomonas sp.]|uniref:cell division protein ZapA n=1 Tax=Nitrosomonas sp. TaxID=42353 RepID=UPI0025EE5232|nr:cell division protein ZapA [Nitrosomonas sp.]MCC6916947.1 cell division protein ZapA [Nitrosomonas sp.]
MNKEAVLNVTVMGREFRIHCSGEERDDLLLAVSYLDRKMREIKSAGKIMGTEQIAIAAAISITHELLDTRSRCDFDMPEFKRRIESLESRLGSVLPGEGTFENKVG